MTQQATITDELAFSQPYGEQEKQILTPEAVEFLTELVSRFTPARNKLLAARLQQQQGAFAIAVKVVVRLIKHHEFRAAIQCAR